MTATKGGFLFGCALGLAFTFVAPKLGACGWDNSSGGGAPEVARPMNDVERAEYVATARCIKAPDWVLEVPFSRIEYCGPPCVRAGFAGEYHPEFDLIAIVPWRSEEVELRKHEAIHALKLKWQGGADPCHRDPLFKLCSTWPVEPCK